VDGADAGYIPGKTYNITVSVKKQGMQAAGFQFVALQNNDVNTSPGSITLTQTSRTQKVDANNPHVQGCNLMQKVWVEHTYQGINSDASGESLWTFEWKAPNSHVGDITFYLAALESDYSGDETGDYVYTKSISSPDLTTSVIESDNPYADLVIFPNPANSKLYLKTHAPDIQQIELLNTHGKLMKRFNNSIPTHNTTAIELDISDISPGVYYVSIQGKKASTVRKIVIQN
jgi:hypothetical protein